MMSKKIEVQTIEAACGTSPIASKQTTLQYQSNEAVGLSEREKTKLCSVCVKGQENNHSFERKKSHYINIFPDAIFSPRVDFPVKISS